MALAAAVLAGTWFLVAFALRIAVQVRRHHDTGVRSDAGPPLSVGWWARLLFTGSTAAVALALVLRALDAVGPVAGLDHPAVAGAGLVLATAGILLTFWAQLAMGASWRIGVDPEERTALVTSGPFAVVRNPIFSTMVPTALGLTLMAPTVAGLVALVALVVALEVQVRGVEEPYLRRVHGAAFDAYAARTGRFAPRLRRVTGGRAGRPGWRRPGAPAPRDRSAPR
jgi:protein-S-isoprenylcysteine O-methyltransferase Ste14